MKKMTFILFFASMVSICSMQVSAQQLGDVNSSGFVDIVDALLIAQYYVGIVPPVFVTANANVNCGGTIDIVDALIVAQYYVGLIPALPGCAESPTPTATPTAIPTMEPTAEPTIVPTPVETPNPTGDNTPIPKGTPLPTPTIPVPTGMLTSSPLPTATPTAAPSPGIMSGDCVMSPNTANVTRGDGFAVSILCNTGSSKLGAYGFSVHYDTTKITVDTTKGINGVSAGSEGFVSTVDATTPGTLVINGVDASGRGPGGSIEVCVVYFKTINLGAFNTYLDVLSLADETGMSFAQHRGFGMTGTVTDAEGFCGIEPAIREVPFEAEPVFIQTIVCNTGSASLSSYEIKVTYDPAMLAPDSRQGLAASVTDTAGFTLVADAGTEGIIRITGTSSLPKGPGVLNLCTIKFVAISAGVSIIGLDVVKLEDASGAQIGTARGFGADITTTSLYLSDEENTNPEIIWTGENYGLLWINCRYYRFEDRSGSSFGLYTPKFVTLDNQGNRIGNEVSLDQEQFATGKYDKNIIWNGSQYAFIWVGAQDSTFDSTHQSLLFETLDPTGAVKRRITIAANKNIDSGPQGLGITWTGEDYLVVWRVLSATGEKEIHMTRLDAAGNRLQDDVLLAVRPATSAPALSNFKTAIWTGSELKYLYFTNAEYPQTWTLYSLSADRYGNVTSDTRFDMDPVNYKLKAITWNNGEYACILSDIFVTTGQVYFAKFDEAGYMIELGTESLMTKLDTFVEAFSILTIGDEYAVNWYYWLTDDFGNRYPIKTYILSSSGGILYRNENAKDVSVSSSSAPDIAWTGNEFGIVYEDARSATDTAPAKAGIFFSRLDSHAGKIGIDVPVAVIITP